MSESTESGRAVSSLSHFSHLIEAAKGRIAKSAFAVSSEKPSDELEWDASILDILVWDRLLDTDPEDLREFAKGSFDVQRGLQSLERSHRYSGRDQIEIIHLCSLAWIGDEPTIAQRTLASLDLSGEPQGDSWADQVVDAALRAWILMFRKRDWADIDRIAYLRSWVDSKKAAEEAEFVFSVDSRSQSRQRAWCMVAGYYLLEAVAMIVEYLTRGRIETAEGNHYAPREDVERVLEQAAYAFASSGDEELAQEVRLLARAAVHVIGNSPWLAVRAAGRRVQRFVAELVSAERSRPMFEFLPPQRQALTGQGMAAGNRRSVVVSMPTSSGKTLISQFRILEALDRLPGENPWVAYIAPNRALVNQVTRRLRRDFSPLGVRVEQLSPALEVDAVERALLGSDDEREFSVLVATPEKFDMLFRSPWAAQTPRPLVLVVADEAHSLADSERGIRLELLLSSVNRKHAEARFLLLTPFIENATDVASWLDADNSEGIRLDLDWSPNDRVLGIAARDRGARGNWRIDFKTLRAPRNALYVEEHLAVAEGRPLGLSYSGASSQSKLAAATAEALSKRGATITVVQQPKHTWAPAQLLAERRAVTATPSNDMAAVIRLVADEYGTSHPLAGLLARGVGVHHSGLSPDTRFLIEWLLETGELSHIVATTTIAAGVNFPVANVVMGSHQYPFGVDMPPSDFWNLVGRAGRADQGQVGVVSLVAGDAEREVLLRRFVDRHVSDLDSSLVAMVREVMRRDGRLDLARLSHDPAWSSFVQFLAHYRRSMRSDSSFSRDAELILRGTLGYKHLRREYAEGAKELLRAVREYGSKLGGAPLALVDATGFSLESVKSTLLRLSEARIDPDVWAGDLFGSDSRRLVELFGVMIEVPELRDFFDINEVAFGQGGFLASVTCDWVNGASIEDIALSHFPAKKGDRVASVTRAARAVYSKIAPAASWGLAAMKSLSGDSSQEGPDFAGYAYYGVNSEAAIALRTSGVPRPAASELTRFMLSRGLKPKTPREARAEVAGLTPVDWSTALGDRGRDYERVWRILAGE